MTIIINPSTTMTLKPHTTTLRIRTIFITTTIFVLMTVTELNTAKGISQPSLQMTMVHVTDPILPLALTSNRIF